MSRTFDWQVDIFTPKSSDVNAVQELSNRLNELDEDFDLQSVVPIQIGDGQSFLLIHRVPVGTLYR
jgi:hypothetical protein